MVIVIISSRGGFSACNYNKTRCVLFNINDSRSPPACSPFGSIWHVNLTFCIELQIILRFYLDLEQFQSKIDTSIWYWCWTSDLHHQRIHVPDVIALCNGNCYSNLDIWITQLNWRTAAWRQIINFLDTFFFFEVIDCVGKLIFSYSSRPDKTVPYLR